MTLKESGHAQELHFAVLAADTAVFAIKDGALHVRLIRVDRLPHYANSKGLTGGLVLPDETAETAARRHVKEKTGIDPAHLYFEQLYTFSDIERDKRGRVVAVAYTALADWERLSEEERKDSLAAWWAPVKNAKHLAYDHDEILKVAVERLRSRIRYTTLLSKLMPKEFTLTELEKAYAAILATSLDKRNFRKKILKLGILTELPKKRTGGRSRPAQLYRFASSAVSEIEIL